MRFGLEKCHSASNIDPQDWRRKLLNRNEYLAHRWGHDWTPIEVTRCRQSCCYRNRLTLGMGGGENSTPIHTTTGLPPSATAPIANSGWNGAPISRASTRSSGACNMAAIGAATGTPPRGSANTTAASPL